MLTDGFPRVDLTHRPTPLEPMPNLSAHLGGPKLWIKRDDCTGLAMGGNKVRQLEFYVGEALAEGADTLITTGAVQSNHVRLTIAAARKLGLSCEVQLEERVPGRSESYYRSGNAMLNRLMGAKIHRFPAGEDEAGAELAMQRIAEGVRSRGGRPHIISLAQDHRPTGSLGYVDAAEEMMQQAGQMSGSIDAVAVTSGSGSTHAGLLAGLRASGNSIPVFGFCARRDAQAQRTRVLERSAQVAAMIRHPDAIAPADVLTDDRFLKPGYGLLSEAVVEAMRLVAFHEGILLDPTYTGKAMAGLLAMIAEGCFSRTENVVFVHTGGTPALFAYPELTDPPDAAGIPAAA